MEADESRRRGERRREADAVVRVYLVVGCNEKISYSLIYMLSGGCRYLSKTFEFLRGYAVSTNIAVNVLRHVDPPSRLPRFGLIIFSTGFRDSNFHLLSRFPRILPFSEEVYFR